ncbi:antibiotic biosynthesis monooxygenase [Trujillonella endophytica]|uniref:Antibiotic biosynthesis monooxygenase n=1 Tax=Trujillonella endophytica TaxID=673521 RepID=A0A1H8WN64_9ACTN|nr:antibiotic biosynthesis monooxygenase [Trujillella endophytica]SEP28877.1 Antibiotic biosynthesis monooxygenase [Trujillella endophytica]
MYARTTTVHGDPNRLDDGIAHVRDTVMPAVMDMDGCVGLSMLADRESGRCIVTAAWQDEQAMRASADTIGPMRERAREIMGADAKMEVQEWEFAVMHRSHEAPQGACTRVVWSKADPGHVDRVLDAYRMTLVPQLEEMRGFCSVSLMIDREKGRAASAVTFDSREAMEATREDAKRMRDTFVSAMEVSITDMAEFELVLAHLRVPEMA